MLSEIKIYEIIITKIIKVPFLFFFKRTKKDTITYELTYRIDEDRFWYYKKNNNKLLEDHLMKTYLDGSIGIMHNIRDRYVSFNELLVEPIKIETFSLSSSNEEMYNLIDQYSTSKENLYKNDDKSNNNNRKFSRSTMFLKDSLEDF